MNIRICRVASIALILGAGFLSGCEEDTIEAEDATAQEQVEEQSGWIDETEQTTTREISESDVARRRTLGEASPPLPIPLEPTEPTQLVAEGVLPPLEPVVATNLLVVGAPPPNAD